MTTTTPLTNPTAQLSRQVHRAQTREAARALARLTPQAQNRGLTQTILDAASTKTAAAAQATTLAKAQLAEAELQAWLKDMDARLEVILAHPEQNLGEIEEQLARSVKEPLRLLAQRAAQVKANAVPCRCPECHGELKQQRHLCRTYKDGEEWKSSNSFGAHNLLVLSLIATRAFEWISAQAGVPEQA
jgi:hypothetical protein